MIGLRNTFEMKSGRNGYVPALMLLFLLCSSCSDSGGGEDSEFGESSASSSGGIPQVKGAWTGHYVVYGGSGAFDGQPVTAKIKQGGDAVVINTNLPTIGRMLTGTINSHGEMTLTDAYDGEVWTTLYGSATSDLIRIADFLVAPSVENPDPPIAVIELRK
ncbi:hypothetical protein P0Y35_02225 [Kiritimatiellaeota bacterium B1221]|nr:hypothetical protein [Kiritimatiellaeota bacterium B1221]